MMEPIIAEYLALLLSHLKMDLAWVGTWWMWALAFIPITFYGIYMAVKWYILLLPITFPLTLWGIWRPSPVHHHYHGPDALDKACAAQASKN